MKIKSLAIAAAITMISFLAYTALAQEKENKGKGKQEKVDKGKGNNGQNSDNRGNSQGQGNGNNGNGNNDNRGNGKDKENKGNNGKSVFTGNDDRGNSEGKGNNENGDGFKWTRENFKDRDKMRNGEKVTICHKVSRENEPGVTLKVSSNALKAHMKHGDVQGECPLAPNKDFTDNYLRKRNDYYNVLQNYEEQSVYSRSVLDYALERLTQSRSQLTSMQNSNAEQAEIERKRQAVQELEENASLLEILLQEGSKLLVNRL